MSYQEKVKHWSAASLWFQAQLERIKEDYEARRLKRKEYYALRKQMNSDWDETMRELNPSPIKHLLDSLDKEKSKEREV